MIKPETDVKPENIGKLFTDGKYYYKLTACQAEPQASFLPVGSEGEEAMTGDVSKFSHLVLLAPVREIKKPRADKGQKHNTKKNDGEGIAGGQST